MRSMVEGRLRLKLALNWKGGSRRNRPSTTRYASGSPPRAGEDQAPTPTCHPGLDPGSRFPTAAKKEAGCRMKSGMTVTSDKRSRGIIGVARHQQTIAPLSRTFLASYEAGFLVSANRASIVGAGIGSNRRRSERDERIHVRSYESRSMSVTDHIGITDELVDAARPWRQLAEMMASPSVRIIVLDEGERIAHVAYDPHGHMRIVQVVFLDGIGRSAIRFDPPFPNRRRLKPAPHHRKIGDCRPAKAVGFHAQNLASPRFGVAA